MCETSHLGVKVLLALGSNNYFNDRIYEGKKIYKLFFYFFESETYKKHSFSQTIQF